MMNKLQLELSRENNDDTIYTNWQISKFSNDFSEFYYKSILLHDINRYLNNGYSKNDIIIFESSIDINSQYTKYRNPELNLSYPEDIVKLYHLDAPVSLNPELEDLALYYLFKAYRTYFSLANKYNLNIGSKKENLAELFTVAKDLSNFNAVRFFKSKIIENNLHDHKHISKALTKIERQFKNLDHRLKNLTQELSDKKTGAHFNQIFNRYDRPIIGIKKPDNKILLLGKEFFVQSEFTYSNDRFLETNYIRQNSPLIMTLTMSTLILPYLLLIGKEKLKLMNEQSLNQQYNTKLAQLEQEITDIEIATQKANVTLVRTIQTLELERTVLNKGHNIMEEFTIKIQ